MWEQEGTLEGVLAQLVEKSEQDRVIGTDIRTLAKKISTLVHDIKVSFFYFRQTWKNAWRRWRKFERKCSGLVRICTQSKKHSAA